MSYVYITPEGKYVVEGHRKSHGGTIEIFNTVDDINQASTFRTEEIYSTIGCKRAERFKACIPKHKAILAKVHRTVELVL